MSEPRETDAGRVPPIGATLAAGPRWPLPRLVAVAVVMAILALPASASSPLKDPTRPPTLKQVKKPPKAARKPLRWVLGSTLVSGQRRTAVINGRVLSVGERIAGARVLEIQPSRVRLRRNGRDITLVLLKQNVKRPSRDGSGIP